MTPKSERVDDEPSDRRKAARRQEDMDQRAKLDGELAGIRTEQLKMDGDIESVQKTVNDAIMAMGRLSDKIPEDLPRRLLTIELTLTQVAENVKSNFVTKTEFEVLKVEHDQVKKIVYGFITVTLLAVITALLALVVHNGGAIVK